MYQQETVEATNTWLEMVVSAETLATSDHVSAAVVNAGGTGYVVGDVLTITHASAFHDCTLEVLTVSSGAILTVAVRNGGAFGERIASAVLGASGGSGYIVGEILEVQDGTGGSRSKGKLKVLTLSGSAVATAEVFEAGGYYSTTPTITDAATISIGPDGHAGDDSALFDLTMQSIIGTTGIAATGGTGSSATFDLTLTATGWSTVYSRNELVSDSLDDMKEVVLLGTVAGGDAPYIGFRTTRHDQGGQKRYAIGLYTMLAFNPALALSAQPGMGPRAWTEATNDGAYLLVAEEVAENNIWGMQISPRRISGFVRGNIATEADSYHTFYIGFLNGFGPQSTTPYPMFVGGSSHNPNRRTSDFDSTGLAEAFQDPASGTGPLYYVKRTDPTSFLTVANALAPTNQQGESIMWPRGIIGNATGSENLLVENNNYRMLNDGLIGSLVRANVTKKVFPAPGTTPVFTLLPLTVVTQGGSGTNSVNTTIVGELDGVFHPPGVNAAGTVHTPEDIILLGGLRYILIPCSTESLANRPYQFMAFRQD